MTLFSFSFDDGVVHIRDKYMNHECTLVIGIRRAFDHLCEVDYKLYIHFIIFQSKFEAITLTWGVSWGWSFDTNSGWDSINFILGKVYKMTTIGTTHPLQIFLPRQHKSATSASGDKRLVKKFLNLVSDDLVSTLTREYSLLYDQVHIA